MDTVSTVLLDRAREPAGLRRMVGISLALHATVLALVILMPAWGAASRRDAPEAAMTITLGGGAPGPVSGGTG